MPTSRTGMRIAMAGAGSLAGVFEQGLCRHRGTLHGR